MSAFLMMLLYPPAHDHYPERPVDVPPSPPRLADEAWRMEYAEYTKRYRIRNGYSEECGYCHIEVLAWDTSYDGWTRCPSCGGC